MIPVTAIRLTIGCVCLIFIWREERSACRGGSNTASTLAVIMIGRRRSQRSAFRNDATNASVNQALRTTLLIVRIPANLSCEGDGINVSLLDDGASPGCGSLLTTHSEGRSFCRKEHLRPLRLSLSCRVVMKVSLTVGNLVTY